MRTFGPKPNVGRRTESADTGARGAARPADSARSAASRFSYSFSEIPLLPRSPSPLPHFDRIQTTFGKHDLGDVRAEVGGAAASMADEMDAVAFTSRERVGFRHQPDLRLAAHEAAHVVQQRSGSAPRGGMGSPNDALERHADAVADRVVADRTAESLLNAVPGTRRRSASTGPPIQLQGDRDTYPWIGEIVGTWSAAMRRTPAKSPDEPHRNTVADLPRGTEVMVTGRRGGWLHVSMLINGVQTGGYVSQELVRYVRASAVELPPTLVTAEIPSISESMVTLKRAETEKGSAGDRFKPTEDRKDEIEIATSVLQRTGRYAVNPVTYRVGFVETAGRQVTITTIEDFILFVEQVERQYPSASGAEIASEIRQLWFSDVNWEILVSSEGVTSGGKAVDIETSPNPIAKRFDMKKLAPKKGGKRFSTALGTVDIGHVMAGIDAALSPFPTSYPKSHLAARGHDDSDAELKYQTLKSASGGDSRDFTTWAGDLGQAYAEYLVERYVNGTSTTLTKFVTKKSPPAELLGDIHGYIAVEVWKSVPRAKSPTGGTFKVSNVLRDLYLAGGSQKTYQHFVEKVSGKSTSELKPFIESRARAFARPWFAKKAKAASFGFGRKTWFGSFTKESALDEWMKEFDRLDAKNDASAAESDTLGKAVDDFITRLGGRLN